MEREETVMEDCKHPDCAYRRMLNSYIECCDYIGATGRSRGCKISECNKYRPGTVKFPDSMILGPE